jgi:hypothetical protein
MDRLVSAVLLSRSGFIMKSAPPPSVVFAVWVLLFAQNTRAASSVTAFDGTWSVTRDTVDDVYRQVVDLLVSQGKSAESEQVLRLLKRKEFQDFVPGETEDATLGGVPQTAYDQHWQERFNTIRDQLAVIGREYSTLVKKESRTDEENQRLAVLESDLATAQQALQQLYQDISVAANPKTKSSSGLLRKISNPTVPRLGNRYHQGRSTAPGAIGFALTNQWRIFSPILLGPFCNHWQLAIVRS